MTDAASDDAKIKVEEIPVETYTFMVPGFGSFPALKFTKEQRGEFVRRFLEFGHVEIEGHVIFACGIVLAKGEPSKIKKAPPGLKIV